ncbi:Uncharacterized protein, UPF0548 family [Nocardioides terrae]|uniref:Uncharacterized protein, UPF0548 family n=1 Tax=Nocardioides terrae TaxID=574651 RepID=A0A1I1L1U7_9ACTN|nr:DUF1990 domain-containing protein [Nocardioides terrae]SFC66512.1 Uncharacterized protein, UPF0548 family [Nocardioides terrae]
MGTSLPAATAAALRAADLTYPEVGATTGALPPGYRHLTRTRILDAADLTTAADRLMTWQVHERAGLRVAASSLRAEPGAVVVMRLGLGPLAVRIPCRVVYVIDEPDRQGFAYGSLPGHPESGEELFLVHQDGGGRVHFTVEVFSRPATLLARAGGVLTRLFQDLMTARYLRVIDR